MTQTFMLVLDINDTNLKLPGKFIRQKLTDWKIFGIIECLISNIKTGLDILLF